MYCFMIKGLKCTQNDEKSLRLLMLKNEISYLNSNELFEKIRFYSSTLKTFALATKYFN